ncbi:hypothetical protein [Flexibacterium corallicola]|uniref:hypothetical protein n=1 Tax=Flexibacterium corallicola TaxID=3037259 RepID=UPI00286F849A|nr:hypothetical protein [Pseudovibrio sp. M1P-2-3]
MVNTKVTKSVPVKVGSGEGLPSVNVDSPRVQEALVMMVAGRVSLAYGVMPTTLFAPNRCAANVARARQATMYLLNVAAGFSQNSAASSVKRERTTARHALRVIEELRDDPAFDGALTTIEEEIKCAIEMAGVLALPLLKGGKHGR